MNDIALVMKDIAPAALGLALSFSLCAVLISLFVFYRVSVWIERTIPLVLEYETKEQAYSIQQSVKQEEDEQETVVIPFREGAALDYDPEIEFLFDHELLCDE